MTGYTAQLLPVREHGIDNRPLGYSHTVSFSDATEDNILTLEVVQATEPTEPVEPFTANGDPVYSVRATPEDMDRIRYGCDLTKPVQDWTQCSYGSLNELMSYPLDHGAEVYYALPDQPEPDDKPVPATGTIDAPPGVGIWSDEYLVAKDHTGKRDLGTKHSYIVTDDIDDETMLAQLEIETKMTTDRDGQARYTLVAVDDNDLKRFRTERPHIAGFVTKMAAVDYRSQAEITQAWERSGTPELNPDMGGDLNALNPSPTPKLTPPTEPDINTQSGIEEMAGQVDSTDRPAQPDKPDSSPEPARAPQPPPSKAQAAITPKPTVSPPSPEPAPSTPPVSRAEAAITRPGPSIQARPNH